MTKQGKNLDIYVYIYIYIYIFGAAVANKFGGLRQYI